MPRKKRRRAHGQGCVYARGPGNWWIKWREGGRVRYKGGLPDEQTAKDVLAVIVADLARGIVALPPEPKHAPKMADLAADWLEERRKTHRAWADDRGRWNNHLKAHFGDLRPDEIDADKIQAFVRAKRETLNPATVGHCVRLLSTMFTDLVEQKRAKANPVRSLTRKTRKLYKPTHNPKNTPFLTSIDMVRRVYLALPEPINVAFAVGAFAGLRTGEVLGLDWRDVDLEAREIRVRQQVQGAALGPLKDDEPREVPILDALLPILRAYKLKTGGVGLLFRPANPKRGGSKAKPPTFIRPHTLHKHLAKALDACKVPRHPEPTPDDPEATRRLTWYECTRHSYASLWVTADGSLEKLAMYMGHSATAVTTHYAHLRPGSRSAADLARLSVDLSPSSSPVATLPGTPIAPIGYTTVTHPGDTHPAASESAV